MIERDVTLRPVPWCQWWGLHCKLLCPAYRPCLGCLRELSLNPVSHLMFGIDDWTSVCACVSVPPLFSERCINGWASQPARGCGASLHKTDSGMELSGSQDTNFQRVAPACVGRQRWELCCPGWAQVWSWDGRGELRYHHHRNRYSLTASINLKFVNWLPDQPVWLPV